VELLDYVIQQALLDLPHPNKVWFGWEVGNNRLLWAEAMTLLTAYW